MWNHFNYLKRKYISVIFSFCCMQFSFFFALLGSSFRQLLLMIYKPIISKEGDLNVLGPAEIVVGSNPTQVDLEVSLVLFSVAYSWETGKVSLGLHLLSHTQSVTLCQNTFIWKKGYFQGKLLLCLGYVVYYVLSCM